MAVSVLEVLSSEEEEESFGNDAVRAVLGGGGAFKDDRAALAVALEFSAVDPAQEDVVDKEDSW